MPSSRNSYQNQSNPVKVQSNISISKGSNSNSTWNKDLTLNFGETPISHGTATCRAVTQDHLAYEENPTTLSSGSGSRPVVIKTASTMALETILESQNSSCYSPSKILVRNDKITSNSCVKEEDEENEGSEIL